MECNEQISKTYDKVHKQLIFLNATRWSFWYDAVERIVELRDKIRQVCTKLNLPKLEAIELEFHDEHDKVTEPVTRALDILQGNKNCFMGTLLIALRKKTISIKQNRSIKHTTALVEVISGGLEVRFAHAFTM